MGYIYKITNPLNMVYVGQTNDFRKRLLSYKEYHKEFYKLNYTNVSVIIDSFYNLGFENHVFQLLEKDVPLNKLVEREKFWINKLNTCFFDNPSGLNKTRGGDGRKYKDGETKKVFYDNFEKWDFEPFTGKDFLEKSKLLKSEFNRHLNLKLGKTFPDWSNKLQAEKRRKKVILYDKGVFVSEFGSTKDCSSFLNISRGCIKDSLLKGSWVRGRYKVNYYTEDYPLEIPFINVRVQGGGKIVYVFDKDMVFLKEYESAEIASKYTGVCGATVRRNALANDLAVTQKGYIFVYKDLYESMTSQLGGGVK